MGDSSIYSLTQKTWYITHAVRGKKSKNLEGFVWEGKVREGQGHKHFHVSIDRVLFAECLLPLDQKPLYCNHPINYNGLTLRV